MRKTRDIFFALACLALAGCAGSREIDADIATMKEKCDELARTMATWTNNPPATEMIKSLPLLRECHECREKLAARYKEMSIAQKRDYTAYLASNQAEGLQLIEQVKKNRLRLASDESPLVEAARRAPEVDPLPPIKVPCYVDCRPDGIAIDSGALLTMNDLAQPGNRLEQLLLDIQAQSDRKEVFLFVRPNSAPYYRLLRASISNYAISADYDAVSAGFVVDWKAIEATHP